MAIDTRNKRASILGLGLASLLALPAPDGSVVQADRQQTALAYSGIAAQQAAAAGPSSSDPLRFEAALARGERPVPVFLFVNAYGVRVWSTQYPPKIADAEGDVHLADGTWKADGSIKAGSGLGPILERSGRVMEIAPVEDGNPELSLEESRRETDPARLTLVLSNDDEAMSALEAQENILSAMVRFALIQPGAETWDDHVVFGDYRVIEHTLERERLTLECRET